MTSVQYFSPGRRDCLKHLHVRHSVLDFPVLTGYGVRSTVTPPENIESCNSMRAGTAAAGMS